MNKIPSPQYSSLTAVLAEPTPSSLWRLRADILERGPGGQKHLLLILERFHHFLNELMASSTAREYSHFASLLDMAAVAGVAFQNLMEVQDSDEWWRRFIIGAASEGFMVLAARQYVKAWEEEMDASYNAAAWYLTQEYWDLSSDLKPDLSAAKRRILIDRLAISLHDAEVDGIVKAGLIVRLFQLLLLARFVLFSLSKGS
jgi:hypothetical protein